MSQPISLTRIVALNWYGFRQIFDVTENILISGAYGTGKSALLDLMQYVLLGEHWRANRAASGNARGRDLVGYCLGDTNQTRDGQRHFLRKSGVTLVALEFTRPAEKNKEPRRETWGIRLEYSSADAAPKHTYFFIPDRLDYAQAAPEGQLLSDEAFRAWIRREFGNDCLFSRQRDYLEEMSTSRHLNFDSVAFHRTFPKAIAFEPEENVEKFIREFILEASPLDVREVRTALRAYDDTRRRLERQEHEAEFLRRIEQHHQQYETSRKEQAILEQVFYLLRQQQTEEKAARHRQELERLESEHAEERKQLQKLELEITEAAKLLDQVRFEIGKDPDGSKIVSLDSQRRDLEAQVNALKEAQKTMRQQLDERARRLNDWLKHGQSLSLDGLKELLRPDEKWMHRLERGPEMERIEAVAPLTRWFNEVWREVEKLVQPVRQEIANTERRLAQLKEDLDRLDKAQAPGSFPFFQAVQQKMGDEAQQLARHIEVKPEAEPWWPALESFLGNHRWTVVVTTLEQYRQALEILPRHPAVRETESLLHPGECRQSRSTILANSLFSKVEVKNPLARNLAERLLGDVVCVDSFAELERCEAVRAITEEGMLKDGPIRQRLKPSGVVELTLGTEGLARMKRARLIQREEAQQELASLKLRQSDVQSWLEAGQKAGLADGAMAVPSGDLSRLDALTSEWGRTVETIKLLMTPERAERQTQLVRYETQYNQFIAKRAVLRSGQENFELRARPLREALHHADEESKAAKMEVEAHRVRLAGQFSGLLDEVFFQRRDEYHRRFPKWGEAYSAVQQEAASMGEKAVEARGKRNTERFALSTDRDEQGNLRHPEYQHDFSTEDESNAAWTNRLRILDEVELQKSRQLAADRKGEWERRLKENVLNEINRRITDAQQTIRSLDRILSQPVGRFRYRISQKRDIAGYAAMWRLLDTGLEPTDPLTAAIQEGEMKQAMTDLMRAVDAPDQADDRTKRLLDYRNYHHYDIEIVPADKPDSPPISLGRSGRNLSGGENQAPFFISMLAAFRRVYDRGDRASIRSQQLGLVVMDEAFSKLSGDGIEDCLHLAKQFQLQLVMAFPPERLGVMVPHAQTVVMCQKNVERDPDGYVTRIDNIPLLLTMAEAVEALA